MMRTNTVSRDSIDTTVTAGELFEEGGEGGEEGGRVLIPIGWVEDKYLKPEKNDSKFISINNALTSSSHFQL